ncbi:MAG: rod shape-determining protein MreC [Parcubacteria group bacterium]
MPRARSILRTSVAVLLVLLILQGLHWLGWLRPVESGVTFVLEPVARGARSVMTRIGSGLKLVGSITELDRENSRLASELERTQAELAQLREDQAELESLRKRLEAPLPDEFKTLVATVIGHDAISGTKRFTINRGASNGLAVGMPVLSEGGVLVGRIDQVLAGQAEVLLLADDRSTVPSRIAESRATGITRGELGLGLRMTDIPQQDTVNQGDQVVTSGLGGDIPAGIPIGTVEAVESASNALFQVARLRPYVDVTELEYLYVLTDF